MKKVQPFSFNYVILKSLNKGPSNKDKLQQECKKFFAGLMDDSKIIESVNSSIRLLTSLQLVEVKTGQTSGSDYIAITSSGVVMIKESYAEVTKEYNDLKNNGRVV